MCVVVIVIFVVCTCGERESVGARMRKGWREGEKEERRRDIRKETN